jgi:hypothetical protein
LDQPHFSDRRSSWTCKFSRLFLQASSRLAAWKPSRQWGRLAASLQGSGAIAQAGGVAAGQGGLAGGRAIVTNCYGQSAPGIDPAPLREAWLHYVVSEAKSLALAGIDPALAQGALD